MASCFLLLSDEESSQKINIDELYEKRKNKDMKQLSIFNKILNRVHKRIKINGRTRQDKFVWFQVPEYIFGEPVYDKGHCIAYVVSKLEENGFAIQFFQPNILHVSWAHWVPTYLRNEITKKTGLLIDEYGNVIHKESREEKEEKERELREQEIKESRENSKNYNPIKNFKPTKDLIYDKELFEKIEKRVSFV